MAPWGRCLLEFLALIIIIGIPGSRCSLLSMDAKQPKPSSRARHHIREHHIPRIIHQSWKTADVPSGFQPWQESWKRNHPGWEYR